MKIHLFKPKYIVRFQSRKLVRWDGITPLALGHPCRYLVERKNDRIWIRDFTQETGIVNKVKNYEMFDLLEQKSIVLNDLHQRDTFQVRVMNEVPAVRWQDLKPSTIIIKEKTILPFEDLLFRKHLQKVAGAMAVILIAVLAGKFMEPTITTNEELIPAKYAKLILTKPKENKSTPNAGGATQSQAAVKAVARAFQSQTVQKSMKSILRGGLSKYSVMATGRAITSLSQKISGQQSVTGVGLQDKASNIMAGANVGNYQMGSDSGYGSGTGVNVKGQGHGQLDIGLNTADATVEEGLTKDEVAKVIHSHMNEIRYCYESAIMRDPNLAGKLLVDFKINASGIVPNAGIGEATLKDPQVTQCLLGKLRSWKFPNPRGGVIVAVSYPFIFKSLSR
jgi:outer membrane biosynthesis protein TonB